MHSERASYSMFLKQTTSNFEYQMLAFQDWITNMEITDPLWFELKKLAHQDSWSDLMIFWHTDSRLRVSPHCYSMQAWTKRWWSSWNCGHWSTSERRIVTRLKLRMHQTPCGKMCQIGHDWGTNCYHNLANSSIKPKKNINKKFDNHPGLNVNTFSICKVQVGWVLSRAGLATTIA